MINMTQRFCITFRRPNLQQDRSFLLQLAAQTSFAFIVGATPASAASHFEQTMKNILHHSRIILVDDTEAGLIHTEIENTAEGPRACLESIRLGDNWQGCKIGEAVMIQLQQECLVQNLPVHLRVKCGTPAQKLYERLGFKSCSTVTATDPFIDMKWMKDFIAPHDLHLIEGPILNQKDLMKKIVAITQHRAHPLR